MNVFFPSTASEVKVVERIVIDDTLSPPPPTQSVDSIEFVGMSYTGIGPPVTSNTTSKRKRRQRKPLSLTPVTTSSYYKRSNHKNNKTNKNNKSKTAKKRKRDPNQETIDESFRKIQKRKIRTTSNGTSDPEWNPSHIDHIQVINDDDDDDDDDIDIHHKNAKKAKARRRSTRIQNQQKKVNENEKKKKLNNNVPLIDLCDENDENRDNNHSDSNNSNNSHNSNNSNNKMIVDNDDSDDVELVEEDINNDIDMKDNDNNNNNKSSPIDNVSIIDEDNDEIMDIDLNDIEIGLIGIAIGKHQNFWTFKEYEIQPKILINKHQNSIELYLESIHGDYVSVSIKTTQIKSLYIPENPSLFDLNELSVNPSNIDEVEEDYDDIKITPYLQVIFIQTKKQLSVYQWLSKYYDPKNIHDPGIERITLIIDGPHQLNTFKQTVLNKDFFCDLTNVVQHIDDDEKSLWLSNLKFKRGVKTKWKRFDTEKTKKYINKLLIPDIDLREQDDDKDIFSKIKDKNDDKDKKDAKQEMNNFLRELKQLNWKLIQVDADGNGLYRCFATEIYGDTNKHKLVRHECMKYMRENREFFENFIPDFDIRIAEKEQENEWGDYVDIVALSELYNVRIRLFEYDDDKNKLNMSFDQGEYEETVNLPLILLARHSIKHYNIIQVVMI